MTVVTFSREAHSGTQDLARLVARRLGYRYVGRDELTQAVAARSGVERVPQTVESEGRALSRWEQLGEQLTGDREAYVAALKAVVTELAMADNVVIVGHGAGQFLRDMRTVVRVFVVAPMQDRIARLLAEAVEDAERARRPRPDREPRYAMRMDLGLRNRVAIVTGSSRGLGKATAVALAQEGARVVLNARTESSLQAAAEEIRSAGGTVEPIVADVTTESGCAQLVDGAIRAFGQVDILVNNAGGGSRARL